MSERDHFSASQINRFLEEPAIWILDRLYGVRGDMGPNAWRGSAVEAACDSVFFNAADDDQALDVAYQTFDGKAMGEVRDDIDKARGEIPLYLANILPEIRQWPAPLGRQVPVSINLPDVQAAIVGYIDWTWPEWLADLKTASRLPSVDPETGRIKDKGDHLRQMAVYWKAKSVSPKLCYVMPGKPDKGKTHKPPLVYCPSTEELDEAYRHLCTAARAMEKLMFAVKVKGRQPDDIAAMYPPRDMQGFLWNDITRAKAIEVWRL